MSIDTLQPINSRNFSYKTYNTLLKVQALKRDNYIIEHMTKLLDFV